MIVPGVLFRLDPDVEDVPIVYSVPHSGTDYPDDFNVAVPLSALRQAEDAHVDQLVADAAKAGIVTLVALFPRAYIDVDRCIDDIDPELLAPPWLGPLRPGPKSDLGIGLIRRLVTPGLAIYDRKLTVTEVQARIDGYYRPFRNALQTLIDGRRQRFGRIWHVDWHAMKSVGNTATPDGASRRPDVVIGTLDGRSCSPTLADFVVETLRSLNLSVAINDPYAGADILETYADPPGGVECLQIELNRTLYMDEATLEKHTGFEELRMALATFSRRLAIAAKSVSEA